MNPEGISVIIPVRDGAAYIREALASVVAQAHADLEVVVVDDGSTDGSGDIAREFPVVRVERLEGVGAGPARNRGVAISGGEFLAFLDADDRWTSGSLAMRMAVFGKDPTLDFVYGRISEFRDGEDAPAMPRATAAAPLPGSIIIRRAAFLRSGGFASSFGRAEVVEWWPRVIDSGVRGRAVEAIVCERRIHAGQSSANRPPPAAAYLKAVRAALERRRAATPGGGS